MVRLTDSEISKISKHLGLSEEDFINRHMVLTPQRTGLTIASTGGGACVFLTEDDGLPTCHIQSVKPQQCRDFPSRWNIDGWEKICRAIPVSNNSNLGEDSANGRSGKRQGVRGKARKK